ncbi:hypothetical protein [Prauserella muralis]|uniref:hypothetical protein n=1 Tax=Prauserella muralis TaxID=588067 RepID=UPI000DD407A5|nr:hypothetical protein [Prauserella muralis]TWE27464.1 hypothetical protein FHX69_0095 [Prauserella muralis]
MANVPPDPATSDDTDMGSARPSIPSAPPKVPRWVKVAAIVVGILVLLVVIVKLTGLGGNHGPGRHLGAGETPSASVIAVQTPSGGRG